MRNDILMMLWETLKGMDQLPAYIEVIEQNKQCIRSFPKSIRREIKPLLAQRRQEKREYFKSLSAAKKQEKLDKRAALQLQWKPKKQARITTRKLKHPGREINESTIRTY